MKICPNCYDRPFPDEQTTCEICGTVLRTAPPLKEQVAPSKYETYFWPFVGILAVICLVLWGIRFTSVLSSEVFVPKNNGLLLVSPVQTESIVPMEEETWFVDPEKLDLQNRIFTEQDFSLALSEDQLDHLENYNWEIYEDFSGNTTDFTKAVWEVSQALAKDGVESLSDFKVHSNAESYLKVVNTLFQYGYYAKSNDISLEMGDFLNDSITIQKEKVPLNDGEISRTLIQLSPDLSYFSGNVHQQALAKMGEWTNDYIEIYHIFYPDRKETEGKWLELLFNPEKPLSFEESAELIDPILDGFISNIYLAEYNEKGLGKFKTSTFIADYSPNYFDYILIPYKKNNDPSSDHTIETFDLKMTDATLDSQLELEVEIELGYNFLEDLGIEREDLLEENAQIIANDVTIQWAEEVATQQKLTQCVLLESKYYPGLFTKISLSLPIAFWDDFILNQEDYNRINRIFTTIVLSYQEDIDASVLEIYKENEDIILAEREELLQESGDELQSTDTEESS